MDPLILSRIQFAANISFHILFPLISIALGWVLLFFKLRFSATGDAAWMRAYFTWVKVFALTFALGVVSGITMSFQFGTNWPGYMQKVGNVAGPLLAYEVLTAFFLEAVFLGIMLFGFRRVSNRVHTLATFLVAFGTTLSAFWILALNSWMQTPAGHEMRDGVAHVVSWWAVIFNPSFPYRLVHMLLASGLTVSFFIAGLSALRYLAGDRSESMWKALRTGVFAAAVLIPMQIFVGDQHGLNTLEHQPQKIAAMEAQLGDSTQRAAGPVRHSRRGEAREPLRVSDPLRRQPDPDAQPRRRRARPRRISSATTRRSSRVFWGFRIMVGTGLLMLAVSWTAAWFLWRRQTLPRPLALLMVPMAVSGWVASLAGWYTTEIGRQPWLVTGILRDGRRARPGAGGQVGADACRLPGALLRCCCIAYLSVLVAAWR